MHGVCRVGRVFSTTALSHVPTSLMCPPRPWRGMVGDCGRWHRVRCVLCGGNRGGVAVCVVLCVIQDEALQQIVAATPVRSTPPSASSPFIFFHARKCAGTSLRAHIATSALASGLPPQQVLVPGAHPVRYDVYTPSVLTPAEASRIAVAGFHISWGRDGFLGVQQPVAPSRHRSCVTVLRDPIDRVVSCYYHRFFYGIQPQRHMWEWAPAELIHILIHFVDQWGDGCLNELLRIFR